MRGIGGMHQRVVIQSNTPSTDTQGGRSSSWGTLATVAASVEPVRGGEGLELQQVMSATAAYDVTIAYRTDVTPKMRLSWTPYLGSAKTLEIHSVQPTPDRFFLKLLCAEGAQ